MRETATGWQGLSGRLAITGAVFAFAVASVDQAFKWWMLGPFDIAGKGRVEVTPFFDLVMTWNHGISYGWFSQDSELGRWLLIGIAMAVSATMAVWLWRTHKPVIAAALGLAIGGAFGNAIDRVIHGAVADFFLLHAFGFSWYVFNLADMAIVAGVALLLYDSWIEDSQRLR